MLGTEGGARREEEGGMGGMRGCVVTLSQPPQPSHPPPPMTSHNPPSTTAPSPLPPPHLPPPPPLLHQIRCWPHADPASARGEGGASGGLRGSCVPRGGAAGGSRKSPALPAAARGALHPRARLRRAGRTRRGAGRGGLLGEPDHLGGGAHSARAGLEAMGGLGTRLSSRFPSCSLRLPTC